MGETHINTIETFESKVSRLFLLTFIKKFLITKIPISFGLVSNFENRNLSKLWKHENLEMKLFHIALPTIQFQCLWILKSIAFLRSISLTLYVQSGDVLTVIVIGWSVSLTKLCPIYQQTQLEVILNTSPSMPVFLNRWAAELFWWAFSIY